MNQDMERYLKRSVQYKKQQEEKEKEKEKPKEKIDTCMQKPKEEGCTLEEALGKVVNHLEKDIPQEHKDVAHEIDRALHLNDYFHPELKTQASDECKDDQKTQKVVDGILKKYQTDHPDGEGKITVEMRKEQVPSESEIERTLKRHVKINH